MKYAVYVEGKSELLFVADVLQKYSNYDPGVCGLRCINLNADDFERMNHPVQGDEQSARFYQIVNVNNDNRAGVHRLPSFWLVCWAERVLSCLNRFLR